MLFRDTLPLNLRRAYDAGFDDGLHGRVDKGPLYTDPTEAAVYGMWFIKGVNYRFREFNGFPPGQVKATEKFQQDVEDYL